MANVMQLNQQMVESYLNHDALGFKDAIGSIFDKVRDIDWLQLLAIVRDALDKIEAVAKLIGGSQVQTLAVESIDQTFVTSAVDDMLAQRGPITLDMGVKEKLTELFMTLLMLYLRSRGIFPTLSAEKVSPQPMFDDPQIPTDAVGSTGSTMETNAVTSGVNAGDPVDSDFVDTVGYACDPADKPSEDYASEPTDPKLTDDSVPRGFE